MLEAEAEVVAGVVVGTPEPREAEAPETVAVEVAKAVAEVIAAKAKKRVVVVATVARAMAGAVKARVKAHPLQHKKRPEVERHSVHP